MAKLIAKVDGFDGDIELLSDRIVIHRKGIFNAFKYGFNAKREIPLSAISEVSFKPPILLGMGTLDFIRSGRVVVDPRKSDTAVRFKKVHLQSFEKFKEKVFEMMEQHAKTHH